MNKQQHIFVWIGIALLVFMAIVFGSKLIWVVAVVTLIGESVFICKSNKLSKGQWALLILAIVVFLIALVSSLPPKYEPATGLAPPLEPLPMSAI